MNISYKFDEAKLERDLEKTLTQVQDLVEETMAKAFEDCTRANFGMVGFERPNDWPPLSPSYALKVGRTYATLQVTGAMKSQLRTEGNVVKLTDDEVNYALKHERGRGVPVRSIFPMLGGECMPLTLADVIRAAGMKLDQIL
jgi:hypothetical protein